MSELPFQPQSIEQMRTRFPEAVREIRPYGDRGQLVHVRRHAFDFDGGPPGAGGWRLVVSIDDGPDIGPKLHASLWRMSRRGRERPLGGSSTSQLDVLRQRLREIAGVTAEPFVVIAQGSPAGVGVYSLHAFFPYTASPGQN